MKFLIDSCVDISISTEQEKVNYFCNYARENYQLSNSLHSFLYDVKKGMESKKDK